MSVRGFMFCCAVLSLGIASCDKERELDSSPERETAQSIASPATALSIPTPLNLAALDPEIASMIAAAIEDVRDRSDDPSSWLRLAQTYHANLQFPEAEAAYERCLELDASSLRARYGLAILQRRLGRGREAIAHMQRVQENAPEQITTYWHLASWLVEEGDLDAATDQMERGRSRSPDVEAGRIIGARIALQRGENEQAIDLLEAVIDDAPGHAYAHFLTGTALRNLRRVEDAKTHFRLAQGEEWTFDDPWMDQVSEFYTGYSAQYRRAMAMLDEGQVDAAIPLLEQLRIRRPEDLGALTGLAGAYRRADRIPDAIALLERVIALEPNAKDLHFHLASAYRQQSQLLSPDVRTELLSKAMLHAEEVVRLGATWAPGHALRGELLGMQGNVNEAVRAFERSMELERTSPLWPLRAGTLLFGAGRFEEATHYLEQAAKLDPQTPEPHLLLAEAHANEGRFDEAVRILESFNQSFPGDERIVRAISMVKSMQENQHRQSSPSEAES